MRGRDRHTEFAGEDDEARCDQIGRQRLPIIHSRYLLAHSVRDTFSVQQPAHRHSEGNRDHAVSYVKRLHDQQETDNLWRVIETARKAHRASTHVVCRIEQALRAYPEKVAVVLVNTLVLCPYCHGDACMRIAHRIKGGFSAKLSNGNKLARPNADTTLLLDTQQRRHFVRYFVEGHCQQDRN